MSSTRKTNANRKRDAYTALRQHVAAYHAIYIVTRGKTAAGYLELTFLATDTAADVTARVAELLCERVYKHRLSEGPVLSVLEAEVGFVLDAVNRELFGEGSTQTVRFVWV